MLSYRSESNKFLSILLLFVLTFGLLAGSFVQANMVNFAAAETNLQSTAYNFSDIEVENSGISLNSVTTYYGDPDNHYTAYQSEWDFLVKGSEVGQYVAFDFQISKTSNYDLALKYHKAAFGSIMSISIDGQTVVDELDGYSATAVKDVIENLGAFSLDRGTHTIKFELVGRTHESARYYYYLHELLIEENPEILMNYNFSDIEVENSGISLNSVTTYYGNLDNHYTAYQSDWDLLVKGSAVGQYIAFDFDVPQSTDYDLGLKYHKAAFGSIASISLDGQIVVDELDTYSAEAVKDEIASLGNHYLNRGSHTIKFEIVGRTHSSARYYMYLHELMLSGVGADAFLDEVVLSAEQTELVVGEAAALDIQAFMSDSSVVDLGLHEVAISSSDENIVQIMDDSLVALSPGIATVEAQVTVGNETKSASIEIGVYTLDHIQASIDQTSLGLGRTGQLNVIGTLTGGNGEKQIDYTASEYITYSSSDETVLTVAQEGLVSTLGEGQATITSTVAQGEYIQTASLDVEVLNLPDRLSITSDPFVLVLDQGDTTTQLYASVKMTNGADADIAQATITYSSDNEAVASVDESGFVTAHAEGIAIITAELVIDETTLTDTWRIAVWDHLDHAKEKQTFYTPEKITNARNNIQLYDWAQDERDSVVAAADQWLANHSLDEMWSMIFGQTIPRASHISYGPNMGSPVTGLSFLDNYSPYDYVLNPEGQQWKVQDPSSGYIFPTNDFESYYKSGLDENGIFNQELADPQYLKNELYPEMGEDWGVDDGYGWVDSNGNAWHFIAYYAHWNYRWTIDSAVSNLRDAYVYTGDVKYARAGTILLDRLADVYPDMSLHVYSDEFYNDGTGGTGHGKVIGSIWETLPMNDWISAYDAFFPAMDDPELVAFLSDKADHYLLTNPKNTGDAIRKNIEDGILREVLPSVKNTELRGNFGHHQRNLAYAAVVLDEEGTSQEILDFLFKSGGLESTNDEWGYRTTGGEVLERLVNKVDRDGMGDEASPNYNRIWISHMTRIAEILDGYERYASADLYQNPKFKQMFYAHYPLIMINKYTPNIGDTGVIGKPDKAFLGIDYLVQGYQQWHDPLLAQVIYWQNGNTAKGLHGSIFSADPNIEEQIKQVIDEYGPIKIDSVNMAGYGFAALRDGELVNEPYGHYFKFRLLDITDQTLATKDFSGSGYIQFENSAGAGESISFAFDARKTDTYEIHIQPYKATSYGIYEIYIDDQLLTTYNFYDSNSGLKQLELFGEMEISEGTHTITFKSIGKQSESSNYKFAVGDMQFLSEEDRTIISNQKNTLRDLMMYYGRNEWAHPHPDSLFIDLYAYGLALTPDLGYPTNFTDPERSDWVEGTISHNTVTVDKYKQKNSWVGVPHHFDDSEMVQLVDVEAPNVYPQTDLYRRTTAMVRVDEEHSYAVDFFRVHGGNDHRFSFHSGPENGVSLEGLNKIDERDSYLEPSEDPTTGFGFIKNTEIYEAVEGKFSVDWDLKDHWDVLPDDDEDINLRLTMLNDVEEVAIGDGVTPTMPGSVDSVKYMIAKRSGEDINSLFTSVIEPYKAERYIENIESAVVTANGVVVDEDVRAVKVTLKNGRIDYIVNALDQQTDYTIDGHIRFKGFFGIYSEMDGKQIYGYINDGEYIGEAEADAAALTGTVVDFTKALSLENEVTVQLEQEIDLSALVGKYIYIDKNHMYDEGRKVLTIEPNAAYKIHGIKFQDGDVVTLDLGGSTTVKSFVDASDLSQGYVYNFEEGASFTIPMEKEIADKEPPVTTVETSAVTGEGTFNASDVQLLFSAADHPNGSGINRTEYRVNDGNWTTVTESVYTLTQDGIYSIDYRSVDRFGHVEEAKHIIVGIDKSAPVIHEPEKLQFLQTDAITIQIDVTDELSGVDEIVVKLDDQYVNNPITLEELSLMPGDHSIQVTATDKLGNRSEAIFTLEIIVGVELLDEVLLLGESNGWVTNHGVYTSLLAKVEAAQNSLSHDNSEASMNALNALRNEIIAQSGDKIETAFAELLLKTIQLIENK